MRFLYVPLLSALLFGRLSCVSFLLVVMLWKGGEGPGHAPHTLDKSVLQLILRALLAEPEPSQHQLETLGPSAQDVTSCVISLQGFELIVLFLGHHSGWHSGASG